MLVDRLMCFYGSGHFARLAWTELQKFDLKIFDTGLIGVKEDGRFPDGHPNDKSYKLRPKD
jgi:hypothetical protein